MPFTPAFNLLCDIELFYNHKIVGKKRPVNLKGTHYNISPRHYNILISFFQGKPVGKWPSASLLALVKQSNAQNVLLSQQE